MHLTKILALSGAMLAGILATSAPSAQTAPATAAAAPAPRPAPPPHKPLEAGPWVFDSEQAKFQVEVVTRDLRNPWSLAFLPDGGMLVTERSGRLRIIRDGVLDPKPIEGLPQIFAFGISGLTDVVLHPKFAENGIIYLAYSKAHPDAGEKPTMQADSAAAVVRAKWDGAYQLSDVEEIFLAAPWYGAPPAVERCCGQGPTFGSYGGRMAFGKDGYLYITSGDRNYGEMVQDQTTHFGKILRIADDGSIPGDNPFVGREGYAPEIWSTGHRNPTGLTVNQKTGEIWETEFGPRGGDEVNRIVKGSNYGWMTVTQGKHYNGEPAKGVTNVDGMTDPVIAFLPESHNPGNLVFYSGAQFPGWEDNLLIAMMDRSLIRVTLDSDGKAIGQETLLKDLGQRLRDVRVAPDGSVYILTDEADGALLKLTAAK